MGPKGIFLSFLIVCSIYFWKKYQKKINGKKSNWVNWVLGCIVIYYTISFIWLFINVKN